MSQSPNAAITRAPRAAAARSSRLVQPAPGPEAPDTRDKAGRQGGMALLLVVGGLFWVGVGAAVVYLMSR